MTTKTWTTKSGKLVTVTGKLITEQDYYVDGHNTTTPACEIYVNVHVEGRGDQGGNVRELTTSELAKSPAGYTHVVGNYALTTEQALIIRSVRAELEATPEWQTKLTHEAAEDLAEIEYQKLARKIEEAE